MLVIGDICEDVYVYGSCNRLAPEAPVPVFTKINEKRNGGSFFGGAPELQ